MSDASKSGNRDSLSWMPTWNDAVRAWGQYWTDWLYSGGMTEKKYDEYLLYKNLPIINSGLAIAEGKKNNQEYMSRYGLQWSDVVHPERLPGTGSLTSGYGGMLNFVSDNVKRLYR